MLFFAYGLDEEYQIVMSYRSVTMDSLFGTMWEPHQSSAFLCALLMKPYLALFGTSGIVLYLRAAGTLIHLRISILLYRTLCKIVQREYAWFLALIYVNTIPKQIITPEFGIMQVWFFTLLMISLWNFAAALKQPSGGAVHLILLGLWMSLEVLSYPSCILLAPFVLLVILWISHRKIWDGLLFVGTCAVCGISYVTLILQKITVTEFVNNLSNIVGGDVTHQSTLLTKLQSAGLSLGKIALLLALICGISMVSYLI
ncbi:MAG: hypothetical protein K6G23_01750, partial [Lachnospiraceae bacterium]|nr:hypothetical protein [Lachnospiraceae bacterium]